MADFTPEGTEALNANKVEPAGGVDPEGLIFIPGQQSPNGQHLLVVANEVGGTTPVFGLTRASKK